MDTFYFNLPKFKCNKWFIKLFAICPLEDGAYATKIYAILVLVITAISFIFQMCGRISMKFNLDFGVSSNTIVVGTVNTIVDALCNIVMTLPALVLSENFKGMVMAQINSLDSLLAKYVGTPSEKASTYFNLLVFNNIFHFALTCNSLSFYFTETEDYFKTYILYYGFDQMYRYRMSILTVYVYYILKELDRKITFINAILTDAFKKYSGKDLPISPKEIMHLRNVVRDVSEMHAQFTQLICFFNKLFGWQLLLVFLNYVTLFIISYETGVRIVLSKIDDDHHQSAVWLCASMSYALV